MASTAAKIWGIIGAMDEEISGLLAIMEQQREEKHAGITFHMGTLHKQHVIVCKSGVGKVNAAICAQFLITHYQVNAILFTGVAGALDPALEIGDIVISNDCMYHDMDASALGFDRGTIPFAETSVFAADPFFVEAAQQAGIDSISEGSKVIRGRILSGDQFIADRDKVHQLHKNFHGTCTEMEGAAVAQVCTLNQIPFVVVRSMSDKADGSASVNFAEFTMQASEQSLNIVIGILKRLQTAVKE